MNKTDILKHVGSIEQLADIRHVTYDDGRARNAKAVEVKNGLMRFSVMEDKCLDISELTYKGLHINFLAKTGLMGRNQFDTRGMEAKRSLMLGLLFTCGFENICTTYYDGKGKEYPFHGRLRTTPASHVCASGNWVNDDYVMEISGDIREAELGGENLLLHRTIKTKLGSYEVEIIDEVSNEAFRDETKMQLYHFNMGYPFLNEKTHVLLPTKEITMKNEIASMHKDEWEYMGKPKDNEPEYIYIHDLASDEEGNTFVACVNDEEEIAFKLMFNKKQLPYFMEWKNTASGDYALGLEPSNSIVWARKWHEKHGNLPMIKAQSREVTKLKFAIIDGKESIEKLKNEVNDLLEKDLVKGVHYEMD